MSLWRGWTKPYRDPPLTCTFPGSKSTSPLQPPALESPELAEGYRNILPLNTGSRSQRLPQTVFPIIPGRTDLVPCLHAPPSPRGHLVPQHGHTCLLYAHLWSLLWRACPQPPISNPSPLPREHCPLALPPGASPMPAAPPPEPRHPGHAGSLKPLLPWGAAFPQCSMQCKEGSVLKAPCWCVRKDSDK